ncbi:MFS transporter [Arthrobacter sulfonylureivorans]|uniref:MFS transporter n=1 Tax=Arthrobacter sulfonylureivorans TaxID=2486855 RepID=A0ABY3WBP9_9MICC|nr:MFS transporter [Arthrobacter sulfonylureivorans]UNK47787.1 MFS transporter [Arthrobacter sulfonylureivorans]
MVQSVDKREPAVGEDLVSGRQRRRSLRASTIGQLLEWYEWSSYAVFAPFIAAAMFNQSDPASALLSTLAVFAVGFLVRPLGGVVFGALSDRKGRKKVMITTMVMMALASVAIGLMPSYETIGLGASIGLLLIRMIQGFAHGGESATANSYIPEIAPRQKRGQWGSLVYVAIFGGSVIAYVLGGIISLVLAESQVAEWGWRIPFILGAFGAVFALYLRRGMHESEIFDEKNDEAAVKPVALSTPVKGGVAGQGAGARNPRPRWVSILLIIGMVSGVTAAHYTWSSYVSTYAITQEGMSIQGAYWVTVVAQVIGLVALPLWGRLSDRVGRKPVIYFFAIAMGVLQIPLMAMITDEPWTLLVASTIALVIVAASGSLLSSIMSEVFPTSQRTQSIGLAYSVSVAGFGGTAPYVYQLFVSIDLAWLSGALVVVLCLLTLVAMKLLPETKGVDLRAV